MESLYLFRCSVWLLLLSCGIATGQPTAGRERHAVVAAAAKFVGVREKGNNQGPPYLLFMKPYGYGAGTSWCGLFAHHVFITAGVKHGVKGPSLARNWAIPPQAIVWRNGIPVRNKPPPMSGDLALFHMRGSRHINHVEVIISWPPGQYCWVIGGNTSDPNNAGIEGVFAKQRLKAQMIVASRIAEPYL